MEKQKFDLLVIELNNGFLVSDNADSYYSKIEQVQFGDDKLEKTFHKGWYFTKSLDNPLFVNPSKKEVDYYQLKENVLETETLHKTTKTLDYESDDRAFYDVVYKDIPETREDVDLTYTVVYKIDDIEKTKGFSFKIKDPKYPNSEPNRTITESNAIYQLVDTIIFPKPALALRPTKLSSEDSFEIIRNYIRDNINPKYAEVTSNYNFCLTVTKKIPLFEHEEYTYNDNFTLFGKKRKPNFKKGYRTERKQVVFECAPRINGEVYSGYTECIQFSGESHEDLIKNINNYLERIMKEINEPLIDCPKCKGRGVVTE